VPEQFLKDSEDIGFMAQIDEWVLKHAGKQIRSWKDEGVSSVCVTVNLSSRAFQDPNLSDRIFKILKETGLPPEYLDIEIEDSVAMGNIENTIARLGELSKMGAHVSIDHFGTGCSSLNQLRTLPIQKLKIDKTFVSDISSNSNSGSLVTAVLLIAHSMNLRVVAEGVETEEQMTFLKNTGCDEIQGFLFSRRPLPAEE
jgi:EAL domain-containing protein (putative c-di-GMP-specific phosphodiesterase class I)